MVALFINKEHKDRVPVPPFLPEMLMSGRQKGCNDFQLKRHKKWGLY